MLILGIESSCDETAAALVLDGNKLLSSSISSQVDIHHPFGGVVPELASRKHIESIVLVVENALEKAGKTPGQIDAIAATRGPGLIGSLLVGFSFAKGYALSLKIPWVGVNHLEGHVNSVFLTPNPPSFPFVALLASGGHTGIYHVMSHTKLEIMGQTRDDAAGEAYDKVAKMLGLGYPGGSIIDSMAKKGDPLKIPFPKPYLDKDAFDFSFSGIKTAVSRYIQNHSETYSREIPDIAAGFQESVVEVLTHKLILAAKVKGVKHVAVVGGVAANSYLRKRIEEAAREKGLSVHIPPAELCGDNAAMIAATGYHYLKKGGSSPMNSDVFSKIPPDQA
jgi:tRNA N6-adenosine threonylcarbamoyltransferase